MAEIVPFPVAGTDQRKLRKWLDDFLSKQGYTPQAAGLVWEEFSALYADLTKHPLQLDVPAGCNDCVEQLRRYMEERFALACTIIVGLIARSHAPQA